MRANEILIGIPIIIILFNEFIRRSFYSEYNVLLFHWIIFGIYIFFYVGTIIVNRTEIKKKKDNNFWTKQYTPFSKQFWIDTYIEYAEYTDNRYFNELSGVYFIEFLNIIISMIMGILILSNKLNKIKSLIKFLLLSQVIICLIYFLSIEMNPFVSLRGTIYAGISFLWILIPSIILVKNDFIFN